LQKSGDFPEVTPLLQSARSASHATLASGRRTLASAMRAETLLDLEIPLEHRAERVVVGPVAAMVLCAAAASAGCGGSDATCESAQGIALVFAPTRGTTRDAEAMRPRIEAISKAQLVIGHAEVVVFFATGESAPFSDAKAKVLDETRPLGLELTTEDRARIERTCDVQLEHREAPIRVDRSR
jgi:hypothetical protein